MKIDWKAKLSSRKFWIALASLVSNIILLFGVDLETGEKICTIISSMGVMCCYLLAEGYIDANRIKENEVITNEENSTPIYDDYNYDDEESDYREVVYQKESGD